MMELFDTHSHIHFVDYGLDADEVWADAEEAGVARMIVVGCRLEDSKSAVEFAKKHDKVWATVGVHPHEAEEFLSRNDAKEKLTALLKDPKQDKIVGIGEFGLDYYYEHSSKPKQIEALELQLDLAAKAGLPVMLHIREAFEDFWPVFDNFSGIRGVVHSFTGTRQDLTEVLKRDLHIGFNGIMTFTKAEEQLEAAKAAPIEKIVLETDAPYLTPRPYRGKICKPEHVGITAKFLAELRGETVEYFAEQTTRNACILFNVD